jgi:hypothetical protein
MQTLSQAKSWWWGRRVLQQWELVGENSGYQQCWGMGVVVEPHMLRVLTQKY